MGPDELAGIDERTGRCGEGVVRSDSAGYSILKESSQRMEMPVESSSSARLKGQAPVQLHKMHPVRPPAPRTTAPEPQRSVKAEILVPFRHGLVAWGFGCDGYYPS